MKLLNKAVIAVAVASLFCVAACKKSNNTDTKADGNEAAAPAAPAALMADQKWDKAEVNGLLTYVPKDSAIVFASTRLLDADNPVTAKVIDFSRKMFDGSQKAMKSATDEDIKAQMAKCDALYKYSDEMLKGSLADIAGRFGINAQFHQDQVVYNIDRTIVMKQSGIIDYKKLTGEMDKVIDLTAKCAGAAAAAPTDAKVGDTTWRVYNIEGLLNTIDLGKDANGKSIIPGKLAMSETNGVVTLALVDEANDALAATLKTAATPITKDDLGKIASDAYGVGYLDVVKTANVVVGLDETMDAACKKEIVDIAGNFPRVNFTYRVDNDGNPLYNDNTIVFADKAELKKLQELFVSHYDLINAKSLAGISLNLDITKTLAYAKGIYDAMSAKNYACDSVKDIQDLFKEAADLSNNPQASMFVNGIAALNVSVENFDMKDPANVVIDAVASLEGASVGTTVPLLLNMAGGSSPELAKALKITKGEVSDIDLTPLVQMPIKLKALLGDTSLVVATDGHDVKAVSDGKKADDKSFLRILFDMSVISKFTEEVPAGLNYKIDGAIGTDADGLTINWNMNYKL